MAELLVIFHCGKADTEVLVEALRHLTTAPVHVRQEQVFGRDFGDARTGEQVRGSLERSTITITASISELDPLVAAVTHARRAMPVRWITVPISGRGRIR